MIDLRIYLETMMETARQLLPLDAFEKVSDVIGPLIRLLHYVRQKFRVFWGSLYCFYYYFCSVYLRFVVLAFIYFLSGCCEANLAFLVLLTWHSLAC